MFFYALFCQHVVYGSSLFFSIFLFLKRKKDALRPRFAGGAHLRASVASLRSAILLHNREPRTTEEYEGGVVMIALFLRRTHYRKKSLREKQKGSRRGNGGSLNVF